MNYTNITECRLCKGSIKEVLSFKNVALANSLTDMQDEVQEKFPLTLIKCNDCGHVQLKETIKPEVLFSHYLYASSDSPALVEHFKSFSKDVSEYVGLETHSKVLEIGCNDGILMKEFLNLGFNLTYGVEPAKNIVKKAKKENSGINIFNCFFDKNSARAIDSLLGSFDLICANNVYAHVANLDEITQGIESLLTRNGVFIFENAYLLDTIKGLYFEQSYHEHLQYYGIKPLVKYFDRFGLSIFRVEYTKIQGGSFRIFVCKNTSSKWKKEKSVEEAIKNEEDFGLYKDETYIQFGQRLEKAKGEMKEFLNKVKNLGKTISCYGCPAKFTLLSHVFGLNKDLIQYVVDDSPLKIGKYSAGEQIQIVSRQHFIEKPTDYCIVSAWNMAEGIMKRNSQYQGKFVIPLPSLEII